MLQMAVFSLYLTIVLSLVWARFRFFTINVGTGRLRALTYDFAVAIQMLSTAWLFYNVTDITKPELIICALLYSLSLVIFWSAISTAKSLDFAFSNHVGSIVTSGPFGVFRHPFYVSYMIAWFASTWLFGTILLWLSFVYLMAFYVMSARKEERMILNSDQASEYQLYQQHVGMFLPRIKRWKRSNSKL